MIVTNEYLLNVHWALDIILGFSEILLKADNKREKLYMTIILLTYV